MGYKHEGSPWPAAGSLSRACTTPPGVRGGVPSEDAMASSLHVDAEVPTAVACIALTAATAAGPVAWICCAVLADADCVGADG